MTASPPFPVEITPPSTPYAALTRLGAPAFMDDIDARLGPAYDAMSSAAIASVFTDEEKDDATSEPVESENESA